MKKSKAELAFNQLKTHLKKHNIKVKLVKRTSYGSNAYGILDVDKKVIEVAKTDNTGKLIPWEDRLFILGHEWRHLLHIKQGMFPEYYMIDYINPKYIKIGHNAEKDCNKWSTEMLKRLKLKSKFSKEKYPVQGVRLYNYVKYLKYGEQIAYIAEINGEYVAKFLIKTLGYDKHLQDFNFFTSFISKF